MVKLEGYSRVAVIKYGCTPYYFALYDDGVDYKVGDFVALSGGSNNEKIAESLNLEEAQARWKKAITSEVIGKIDNVAYEKRVEHRKEKEQLKKELDVRKKEIQEKLDNEYYASKDEVFAELLQRYESL